MKMKFTKEEMALLNAICDIEVNAEGVKTYSMKPMVINEEGETQVELVKFIQEQGVAHKNGLINEMTSGNKFLSDPSVSFDSNIPSPSKTHIEYIIGNGKTKVSSPIGHLDKCEKIKEEGFITTDIVDRRDVNSLHDVVRRLSEIK